ncbi:hypothetical protein BCR42DRAFT_418110 [Absidia repens]|uniref:P-loop containing nucleoside triphosphate hydrolase protein n=1 Tax=Absidia repens TaxID=90262 RepID=A0A1X2ICU8_9FUNG|nr:hypothetical protein BCR42DRAFT_418110 [Absidia repens]
MASCQLLPQTKASLQHIVDYTSTTNTKQPLVVGIAGLPRIGKTTLCHTLSYALEQDYGLETATLSLDTHSTSNNSLAEVLATLKNWIRTEAYPVIFVEGIFMGYKALSSTHRIWSQLSKQQQQQPQQSQQSPNNDPFLALQKFNQTLIPLELNLYPLINLFIQLSANELEDWQASLGKQSTVFQLYLERLDKFGFFDQDERQQTNNNSSRHLVLFLDKDRRLIRQQKVIDGLRSQQLQQQQQLSKVGNVKHQVVSTTTTAKRTTASTAANRDHRRRTWLLSPLMQQQRKYIIATLNPRVLISFAMMSLLGLLGYSRRLSFILDFFNKINQFVL